MSLPTISVVVVNYNGLEHLKACFDSLEKQTYPHELLELLLIDNNSHDDSCEWMAEYFPHVQIIHNHENIGFAAAVNQGAQAASGTYLALLNNDAYADSNWLTELVACIQAEQDSGVICVGSMMYDWHGQAIDFIRAGINFYGYGDQFFHGVAKDTLEWKRQPAIMACGGAMLVDRKHFLELGGFDPDFFAYFEDVDFGWRTWLAGYKILIEPRSFVYHRSHGTASSFRDDQIWMLHQRNALATIIKNYSEDSLKQTLPAALMLLIQKSIDAAGAAVPWEQFDLRYRGEHSLALEVPRSAFSYIAAARDILEHFEYWWAKRSQVQNLRQRSDNDILPLFEFPLGIFHDHSNYRYLHQVLVETFGITKLFDHAKTTRVLVVSGDPLYATIAGGGMRALEMARALAPHTHVTLAAPEKAEVNLEDVQVIAFTGRDVKLIKRLVADADVVIINGHVLYTYPAFLTIRRTLVIDVYVPAHFENMDAHLKRESELDAAIDYSLRDISVIDHLLKIGDFFICASERQRDMWLGWLSAAKRITPAGYVQDPSFRSLIDVVPFGLPDEPPVTTERVLKGVIPGIEVDDTVLLWNGGIWDWFDPLTLIQAMSQLQAKRPDVKLFFMGARHPNPVVPNMRMYDQAVALAEELGLRDQTVFFNTSWVPYDERQNYLLEADWSITTYTEHIETHFSFRTRYLDCLWAGLPLIVNRGDVLAEYIEQHGLGYVLPSGDVESLTNALLKAVAEVNPKKQRQTAFAKAQQTFAWSNTVKSLINFCKQPHFAADYKLNPFQQTALQSYQRLYELQLRNHWLDDVVQAKDEQIAYLEEHIRQLQQNRVMQGMLKLQQLQGLSFRETLKQLKQVYQADANGPTQTDD